MPKPSWLFSAIRKGPGGNEHGMFQKRWADHDYHEEGGESLRMVQERNIATLRDILCANEGMEFVGKKEHLYIEKEFRGKARADKGKTEEVQAENVYADKVQLLYGTGNQAKLSAMRRHLELLGLEIIGLKDMEQDFSSIPEVKEDGATPLENAEKKALAYYRAFRLPVFSCDSGLYFEGVPEEEQPGVHVRNVRGKTLTDEEMLEYYAGMAEKYGGLKAVYRNAVCLVFDEVHIHKAMEKSMESEPFLITSRPHKDGIREKGFPLDCLSVHMETGQYYYDLPEEKLEQIAVEDGFLDFFKQHIKTIP